MMESLGTGQCLWVITNHNIFGFRVENLEHLENTNEARDWKSIPLPFDFHLKLPERDLFPFLFDSKLFFAGGTDHSSIKIRQLSFAGGTTLDTVAADTIPEPPTFLHKCFLATIEGHVYLLIHDAMGEEREMGFWILRSNQWERLSSPPSLLNFDPYAGLDDEDLLTDDDEEDEYIPNDKALFSRNNQIYFGNRFWECFVWKHKLFLITEPFPRPEQIIIGENNNVFYVYDTRENKWEQIEPPFSCFVDDGYHYGIVAVPSLGDVSDCNVALSWSTEGLPAPSQGEIKLHALLVDNQDNCVRHQCLDELSEDIPSCFAWDLPMGVNFVDLGEGKVCVLIGGWSQDALINIMGYSKDCKRSEAGSQYYLILCVLVLKLGNVKVEQEEGQRFLSVKVLVNQVYNMESYTVDNRTEVPKSSFLFSTQGLGCSIASMVDIPKYPKAPFFSRPKLASLKAIQEHSTSKNDSHL